MPKQKKPAADGGSHVIVSVRMEKELIDGLRAVLEKEDRTVSWLVRKLVREYLGKGK